MSRPGRLGLRACVALVALLLACFAQCASGNDVLMPDEPAAEEPDSGEAVAAADACPAGALWRVSGLP